MAMSAKLLTHLHSEVAFAVVFSIMLRCSTCPFCQEEIKGTAWPTVKGNTGSVFHDQLEFSSDIEVLCLWLTVRKDMCHSAEKDQLNSKKSPDRCYVKHRNKLRECRMGIKFLLAVVAFCGPDGASHQSD